MESLIELVAASLARHGIECPDGDSVWRRSASSVPVATESTPPTALPDHNYRKKSDGDPAP